MDNTKAAVDIFNKYAKDYTEKFFDTSLYHDSLNVFCDAIKKKKAEILELACGPGNITKYLSHKRPDLKILATDLAPNMIEIAKKNNPNVKFQFLDSRNILSLNKKFDGIVCGFVMPYLSEQEIEKLFSDASKILNLHGVIYVSTMEENEENKSRERMTSFGEKMYMYFHKSEFLQSAFEKNNFKVVDLQRKIYTGNDGTKTTDLMMVAVLR